MATNEEFGKAAYEAYCESVGNISRYTNSTLPPWEEVLPAVRKGWEAAANAVLQYLEILERGKL
jgi:hypothetical protein